MPVIGIDGKIELYFMVVSYLRMAQLCGCSGGLLAKRRVLFVSGAYFRGSVANVSKPKNRTTLD